MDQSQCVVRICQNVSNFNKGNLEKMRLSSVRRGTGINVIWKQAKWNEIKLLMESWDHVYLLN